MKFVGTRLGNKFHVMALFMASQRHQIQLIWAWAIWLSWIDALEVKNQKSIGLPSTEAGHDVKFVGLGNKFCVMSPLMASPRP